MTHYLAALVVCALVASGAPAKALPCSATGSYSTDPFALTWSMVASEDGTFAGIAFANPSGVIPISGRIEGEVLQFEDPLFGGATGVWTDDCASIAIYGPPLATLTLTRLRDTVCGDGNVDAGEECDDGNFQNGDTCTVACAPAGCGNLVLEGLEECDDGNVADSDGCSFDCKACGNGIIDSGEDCDDGNRNLGDGCDHLCQLQVCGNSVPEPGEECDDGNTTSGDGCASTCVIEGCPLTGAWRPAANSPYPFRLFLLEAPDFTVSGALVIGTSTYVGSGTRSERVVQLTFESGLVGAGFEEACDTLTLRLNDSITLAFERVNNIPCGDGVQQAQEECDDGNFLVGDGCQPSCTIPRCGDGFPDAIEECDDGNDVNGDGCSECIQCGNRVVGPGEECDTTPGCTGSCKLAGCSPSPLSSCVKPTGTGRSTLHFRRPKRAGRESVEWKWQRGPGVGIYPYFLGDPTTETNFRLCAYTPSLTFEAAVPANVSCGGDCWSGTSELFRYSSREATPDGITSMSLARASRRGTKLLVKGKGPLLTGRPFGLPLLPPQVPLTVQLQGSHGYCFEAQFPETGVKRARPTDFFAFGGSPSAAFLPAGDR